MKRYLLFSLFVFSLTACKDEPAQETTEETTANDVIVPSFISYSIVNQYPHDPAAFTEGLEYADGHLYESTGNRGESWLRKVDLSTGKVLQQHNLQDKYFGEGLTILNGKIYQLTYQEKTGFVYDQKTMKLEKTFSFNTGEGWGMTNDGTNIIYGDGSSTLYYLDPNTLQEVKRLNVTDQYGDVKEVNELEYIKGHIYANIWRQDLIIKIDPATGKVVGKVNLGDLRRNIGLPQLSGAEGEPEVLNGIAYDKTGNRIFITGKYWPKILEVKLDN